MALHPLNDGHSDTMLNMQAYLAASAIIDHDHPAVAAQARTLAAGADSDEMIVRHCFTFVRDEIQHSVDFKRNPVTCRASDVLRHGTGYCYAKSHLLAALLRHNGIATGLCYQRLAVGDAGPPFCLHGLNAVWLPAYGWLRLDARGNKPGVNAQFCPPQEQLAFAIRDPQERDLPEIWSEPLPQVVATLEQYTDYQDVLRNLPDIVLLPHTAHKETP